MIEKTKPIEEVSSLKWQVSSKPDAAADPPGLPTSNFTPETVAEPRMTSLTFVGAVAEQSQFPGPAFGAGRQGRYPAVGRSVPASGRKDQSNPRKRGTPNGYVWKPSPCADRGLSFDVATLRLTDEGRGGYNINLEWGPLARFPCRVLRVLTCTPVRPCGGAGRGRCSEEHLRICEGTHAGWGGCSQARSIAERWVLS